MAEAPPGFEPLVRGAAKPRTSSEGAVARQYYGVGDFSVGSLGESGPRHTGEGITSMMAKAKKAASFICLLLHAEVNE